MRTTVNIDEHLLAEAKVRAAREHRALGDVINDALRANFATDSSQASPVSLPTYGSPRVPPLVDIHDRGALAEALGDNEDSGVPR